MLKVVFCLWVDNVYFDTPPRVEGPILTIANNEYSAEFEDQYEDNQIQEDEGDTWSS